MGDGKARERGRVFVGFGWSVETTEVAIQGGLVVEGVDAIGGASRHRHRVAHLPPAVAYSDAHRCVRGDRSGDDSVAQHLLAVELEGGLHLQAIPGAPAHQGHAGAHDAVGPPDDFSLVAG